MCENLAFVLFIALIFVCSNTKHAHALPTLLPRGNITSLMEISNATSTTESDHTPDFATIVHHVSSTTSPTPSSSPSSSTKQQPGHLLMTTLLKLTPRPTTIRYPSSSAPSSTPAQRTTASSLLPRSKGFFSFPDCDNKVAFVFAIIFALIFGAFGVVVLLTVLWVFIRILLVVFFCLAYFLVYVPCHTFAPCSCCSPQQQEAYDDHNILRSQSAATLVVA